MAWLLTIILVGTTIEFQEPKPFLTLEECKKEGFRIVRDYQEGQIQAHWECELINTTAGEMPEDIIARH